MQFERNAIDWGGSVGVVIPADLAKHLNIKAGDIVVFQDEVNKNKKKFCSFWKKGN
jgi:antitoxin component of MazEF toxin-antitoxin module